MSCSLHMSPPHRDQSPAFRRAAPTEWLSDCLTVTQVTEAAELSANMAAAGVQPGDGFGGTADGATNGAADGAEHSGNGEMPPPPPPPPAEEEEALDADELFSMMPMTPGVSPCLMLVHSLHTTCNPACWWNRGCKPQRAHPLAAHTSACGTQLRMQSGAASLPNAHYRSTNCCAQSLCQSVTHSPWVFCCLGELTDLHASHRGILCATH